MKRQEPGLRVRVYIGDHDQWQGKTLYVAIVQEARKHALAGATVTRGIIGFGAHSVIHEQHAFHFSDERPVVVEIVDSEEKVRAFLPCLDQMVREGMVTTSEVVVTTYGKE